MANYATINKSISVEASPNQFNNDCDFFPVNSLIWVNANSGTVIKNAPFTAGHILTLSGFTRATSPTSVHRIQLGFEYSTAFSYKRTIEANYYNTKWYQFTLTAVN